MSNAQVPSEAARKKFMGKLKQFRGTLDSSEQQMLDALVTAALAGREPEDVAPYWFGSPLGGSGIQAPGSTANVWTTPEGGNTPFSS